MKHLTISGSRLSFPGTLDWGRHFFGGRVLGLKFGFRMIVRDKCLFHQNPSARCPTLKAASADSRTLVAAGLTSQGCDKA